MLTVPMRDHKDEVIGVVQLINKKRSRDTVLRPVSIVEEEVIPFISVDQQLVDSLASQAAVAFRNAALLKNIRELFENFVTAAVTAIEKRDPATSGHSERVAILTVDLAKYVDRVSAGTLGDLSFTREQLEEIRYASKLHDFGKVAVPEKVLKKENKLLASELKSIELRLAYRARMLEVEHLRRKLQGIDSKRLSAAELAALDASYAEECRRSNASSASYAWPTSRGSRRTRVLKRSRQRSKPFRPWKSEASTAGDWSRTSLSTSGRGAPSSARGSGRRS